MKTFYILSMLAATLIGFSVSFINEPYLRGPLMGAGVWVAFIALKALKDWK